MEVIHQPYYTFPENRDRVIDIVTAYGLVDRGVVVLVPVVSRIVTSPYSPDRMGSTQSYIQWVQRTLSQGVKRPGPEAENSLPSSAEVKKTWIYTTIPHTTSWHSA
jgi:hypothetical protein